jgi:hypothetical protein
MTLTHHLNQMKLFNAIAALTLASTTLVGCGESNPSAFGKIEAKVYCESLIKKQLRDPDSYRFEKATVLSTHGKFNQYGTARVNFRSKNGFGGYVNGNATCTAYAQNGDLWHRAVIN